ncbi:hypothetical protein [Streptomyces thermolilacinus]|uniref:Cytochrome C oxidase subunit I n=1 Tax=Streptomyces thermolilacinus SPC6 TaxID=1306406 RepID=A0A1D3DM12_9ACTN|nr:hypothetical protein [Streptomyces thermolilacinus]OEJ93364.1 hypothetical protein J116_001655 [Streptomyces thermolilacinus SPC6]
MRGRAHGRARSDDTAAGMACLEGYLIAEAHLREARTRADAFVQRLPWLTTAEREEVAERYAEAYTDQATQALRMVARRAAELREEYTQRYAYLRRRLLCATVATLAAGVAALGGLAAWTLTLPPR